MVLLCFQSKGFITMYNTSICTLNKMFKTWHLCNISIKWFDVQTHTFSINGVNKWCNSPHHFIMRLQLVGHWTFHYVASSVWKSMYISQHLFPVRCQMLMHSVWVYDCEGHFMKVFWCLHNSTSSEDYSAFSFISGKIRYRWCSKVGWQFLPLTIRNHKFQ